jgi:hypothetical protein
MSRDYMPEWDGPLPVPAKAPELPATKRYPICPECGCNTLVMFTPARDGIVGTDEGYRLYAEKNWAEYVDWNKAHLYCCNGETNCEVSIPVIGGAMTPVNEKRRRFSEVPA